MANASKEATSACAEGSPHVVHEVLLPVPDPGLKSQPRLDSLGLEHYFSHSPLT